MAWGSRLPAHAAAYVLSPAHAWPQMYHIPLTMDCYWACPGLQLSGSDKIQFQVHSHLVPLSQMLHLYQSLVAQQELFFKKHMIICQEGVV